MPRKGKGNHDEKMTAKVRETGIKDICPVTGGRPTRMSEASFQRICRLRRDQKNGWSWGAGQAVWGCTKKRVCPTPPPEVEFIEL